MRRILIAGFVALPVLATLVFLGTWQLQRLHWKTDLLASLAAAEAAPAAPLRDPPEPYVKVAVTGRFDHQREALLGLEVRGAVLGAHLITPLLRDGAPPVLVDRGWVPVESRVPIARPEGPVTLEGYVRPSDRPNLFSARDDTAARRFFTFDTGAIGAALGLAEVASYGVVALGAGRGTLPDPARSLPRPPNNHLGYVITWYGLALALVGVFLAWAFRRERNAP
jgi:surfeit locus 1 family protein